MSSFKKITEDSCFTVSCYFLLYGRVSEPYVYIYLLFFGFPSHLGYHRAPSRVLSLALCLYMVMCVWKSPSPSSLHSPFPPLDVVCPFSISVSSSALKIGSSVPFSRFYIYALINGICPSFCAVFPYRFLSILRDHRSYVASAHIYFKLGPYGSLPYLSSLVVR